MADEYQKLDSFSVDYLKKDGALRDKSVHLWNLATDVYSEGDNCATLSTILGFSSFVTKKIYVNSIGKLSVVTFELNGVSDATGVSFTIPFTSSNTISTYGCAYVADNGVGQASGGLIQNAPSTNIVYVSKNMAGAVFTASGGKVAIGQIILHRA